MPCSKLLINSIDKLLHASNLSKLDRINNIIFSFILFKMNTYKTDGCIKHHIKEVTGIDFNTIITHDIFLDFLNKISESRYNLLLLNIDTRIFNNDLLESMELIFNQHTDVTISPSDLINTIYKHFIKNDTLVEKKEYDRYYNNELLVSWIVEFVSNNTKITDTDMIFEGNMKVNSYTKKLLEYNLSININNIYGFQENPIIKSHISYEIYSNTDKYISICSNDIIKSDIIIHDNYGKFNFIIFDTIMNKHNITHASCCERIKQYKIRGTNYESLIIQLIMSMLYKNGSAFIIVPDSFLLNDSNQMVDTRKYLIENFNVKNIIEINEMYYNIKGSRNSIIYFENNGSTQNIIYSTLNNNINDYNTTINIEMIKKNNYSLYYKLYEIPTTSNIIEYNMINNIFNFIYDESKITKDNILIFDKYYKDYDFVKISTKVNIPKDFYLILEENLENTIFIPNFCIYYLEFLLRTKPHLYLKGKLNQVDINKLYKVQIPIISKKVQETVINYYTQANYIYNQNLLQIENYIILKKSLFDIIETDKYVKLDTIVSIYTNDDFVNNEANQSVISIIRNSSSAGLIQLLTNITLSNNSYYLVPSSNIPIEYIYHYMWFIKDTINKLVNITKKPLLSMHQLSSISIPIISGEIMDNIITYCNFFDNNIEKTQLENTNIKDKDILILMSKINNFSPFAQ